QFEAGASDRWTEALLEDHSETQPELPLIDPLAGEVCHAGDRHEVLSVGDVVVRYIEMGRVREVEGLRAKLQLHGLGQRELARQAEVPVEQTRRAQNVKAGVAEARRGDVGERGRIVVRRSPPYPAELVHRFHLVRRLDTSWQVQGSVVGEDGEGGAAHD